MTIVLRLPSPIFALPALSVLLAVVTLLVTLPMPRAPEMTYGPPLPPIASGIADYGRLAKSTLRLGSDFGIVIETQDRRVTTLRGPLIEIVGQI